ncbi:hypothetical protein CTAYLR_009481 [Chrysophaeum taylorii]|uniref:Uncharacterized protein n=1 Tax=Chrysophaeum taylorii TaxID=2483200 RepID=A0AAD7UKJ2_9STRA|nr:hypothetical protein CTAYLR_009481 [Chrysophaeum taylorii]
MVDLVFRGDANALRRLLAADPEVATARDTTLNDSTPLHVAVAENEEACALALLEACPGAALVTDGDRRVPLHHCGPSTTSALAEKLCEASPLDARDLGGRTPLHYAAEAMAVDAAIALLRSGADPTIACDEGLTPMAVASGKDDDDDDDFPPNNYYEFPPRNYLIREAIAARLGEPTVDVDWNLVANLDDHDWEVSFLDTPGAPGDHVTLSLKALCNDDDEDDEEDDVEESTVLEANVDAVLVDCQDDDPTSSSKWRCWLAETPPSEFQDRCAHLMLLRGRELIVSTTRSL